MFIKFYDISTPYWKNDLSLTADFAAIGDFALEYINNEYFFITVIKNNIMCYISARCGNLMVNTNKDDAIIFRKDRYFITCDNKYILGYKYNKLDLIPNLNNETMNIYFIEMLKCGSPLIELIKQNKN